MTFRRLRTTSTIMPVLTAEVEAWLASSASRSATATTRSMAASSLAAVLRFSSM